MPDEPIAAARIRRLHWIKLPVLRTLLVRSYAGWAICAVDEQLAAMPNPVTASGSLLCLRGGLDGRLDQWLRLDAYGAISLS